MAEAATDGPTKEPGPGTQPLELDDHVKGVSLWKDAWRRLSKNKLAMIGLILAWIPTLVF